MKWKPSFVLAGGLAAVLLLANLSEPVSAAQESAITPGNGTAVGLIVHLSYGQSMYRTDGQIVGQSDLANIGVNIKNGAALGAGFHAVTFTNGVTEQTAQAALAVMKTEPGVTSASIDRFISTQAALNLSPTAQGLKAASHKKAPSSLGKPIVGAGAGNNSQANSTAFKGASAVRGLKVTDAWSATAPGVPQLKASWVKPLNLNGALLTGYRVQTSADAGLTVVTLTQPLSAKTTSLLISQGLSAGVSLSVRVAALTKVGNITKAGTYSAWMDGTPTTAPTPPTFNTPATATNAAMPAWDLLSGSDTGGLPVIYTLTATAPGQPTVTCQTKLNTCSLVGLAQGIVYAVKLVAANARGSAIAVSGFSAKDPLYSKQWALNSPYGINIESAWQHTHGSATVTVAVIDSGITAHPDLDGQEWRNPNGSVYGYDVVDNDADPSDPSSLSDWHGTHVSGIIAAASNNIGVVGVAPGVKLLEIRALSGSGGTSSGLIEALNWAAGVDVPNLPKNIHPAQVVNLSLGSDGITRCDALTSAVMQNLHDMNVTVITAAGNAGEQPWGDASNSYPGNCYPTINVGATGYTGDRAYYSDYGKGVDISAPGGDQKTPGAAPQDSTKLGDGTGMILSTYNLGAPAAGSNQPAGPAGATYDYLEGTSMAAPMVTGVVALIYSLRPNVTPYQVFWDLLQPSVTKFPAGSTCATALPAVGCGAGILNAAGALDLTSKLPQP